MTHPNAEPLRPTRTHPWTPSDTAAAVEMWRAGRTAAEIAASLGKSRNAVLGKIARLGLNRSARRRTAAPPAGRTARARPPSRRQARLPARWGASQQEMLRAFWADGLSPDEIAARLGCREATVIRRAADDGLVSVEEPERHVCADWFARNDARFRAAMRRALDRGLVTLPAEGGIHGE